MKRVLSVCLAALTAASVVVTPVFGEVGEISTRTQETVSRAEKQGVQETGEKDINGGSIADTVFRGLLYDLLRGMRGTAEEAVTALMGVFDGVQEGSIASPDFGGSFADGMNAQMPRDRNYMFSPMSIKMALAMAANGASGDTRAEILTALDISDPDAFNEASKDLITRYSQSDALCLNIANSIWMNGDNTSQNFSDAFKEVVTDFYHGDVKATADGKAAAEVNAWVNEKTKGKIPYILEEGSDFVAMLVNAIYFKGAWLHEFGEGATAPDEFTSGDGSKVQLDFMNKTKWLSYGETRSVRMVELPYKNRVDKVSETGEYLDTEVYDDLNVSMYLIDAEGDVNVEQELNAAIADGLFRSTYVRLSVPKFRIEYETSLNDSLKALGIRSAFGGKADFRNMFDSGNMWFSDTIHKTYIEVDEKGTEAAAVTAIGMMTSARPSQPVELKFNKPFYFVIRDNISGETLFMGRYAYGK